MSTTMIAVVTGANRGIGEAICRSLASAVQGPFVLYATSRKGLDLGIQPFSKETLIKYPKLEICDSASIKSLADSIRKDYGALDVLINNAGICLDGNSSAEIKQTLDVNYRATLEMCQLFIPLLKRTGRIVNVSSISSTLDQFGEKIQERFRTTRSLQDLEDLIANYEKCEDDGTAHENGWRARAYGVSKAAMNSFSAVLARENPGLLINSCCPGWVLTDMGSRVGTPTKTAADGAKIPIRLGFKDIDGITGKYWANPSISDSDEGRVMEW
ncbi:hypothetical protein MMC07_001259 [Pseudocyphellaria aurata]|nr:hypothetical protein [Pseudocyphellaria aurata]